MCHEIERLLRHVFQSGELRSAIEQQREAFLAAQRRRLIHATGGSPGHLILRTNGSLDQRHATGIHLAIAQAEHVIESERRGACHRGGRAQASTERNARRESSVEALYRKICLAQRPCHAKGVSGPPLNSTGLELSEIHLDHIVRFHGRYDAGNGVFARAHRDEGAMRQSDGQAQPSVVIRMFTDNIDSSRSAPYALRLAVICLLKQCRSIVGTSRRGECIDEFDLVGFNFSHWFLLVILGSQSC